MFYYYYYFYHSFIILANFPCYQFWPVLLQLSSANPPYVLHPVAQLPSFPCSPLPCQSIVSMVCLFLRAIFNSNTLYLHLLISSYNISNPPQFVCFKCSSCTLHFVSNAPPVLSTLPQMLLLYSPLCLKCSSDRKSVV